MADLGLPGFLAVMGAAVPLAATRRVMQGQSRLKVLQHAILRAGVLVVLGLLLNAMPFVSFSPELGWHDNVRNLRIPGVLQRIAICYIIGVGLYLYVRPRVWIGLGIGILLIYAAMLVYVPVPGYGAGHLDIPRETLPAYVDRLVFGDHLWVACDREWDPEGLLSTLSAVTTTLIGVWVGHVLLTNPSKKDKAQKFLQVGILFVIGGLAWGEVLPINKALWTPSYSMFMGGLFLLAYTLIYGAIEIQGWRKWGRPLQLFGINAITVYVASILATVAMRKVLLLGGHVPMDAVNHIVYLLDIPRTPVMFGLSLTWIGLGYVGVKLLYQYGWRVSCTGIRRIGQADSGGRTNTKRRGPVCRLDEEALPGLEEYDASKFPAPDATGIQTA